MTETLDGGLFWIVLPLVMAVVVIAVINRKSLVLPVWIVAGVVASLVAAWLLMQAVDSCR